jgi:hypothetical protein
MGGYFSGRRDGGPVVEDGVTVSLSGMLRSGWIRDGASGDGSLTWSRNGERFADIRYGYDMRDPDNAWIELRYRSRPAGGEWSDKCQRVRLSFTVPHYGGRRWFMHCPHNGGRVDKLHLPPGGALFASRKAWRLGYRSQRVAHRDRAFEKLFRLQAKLGSDQGWEAGLRRPKGMWKRTFDRHWDRYWALDAECGREMAGVLARFTKYG